MGDAHDEMHDRINYAKNKTKHMDGKGDSFVEFDPRGEARDSLDRAISDFVTLMGVHDLSFTERMRKFESERQTPGVLAALRSATPI